MPSEAEKYKLILSTSQLTTNSVDWCQGAKDLGAPNAKAANLLWLLLKDPYGYNLG
jgi:hypothetical protein